MKWFISWTLLLPCIAQSASVPLAWDASPGPGVVEYIVHYGTSPGVYTSHESAGMSLTKTISGLPDGFRYYFAITAKSVTGESDRSNEVNYKMAVTNPPVQILIGAEAAELELPFVLVTDEGSTYAVSTNNNVGTCNFKFNVPFVDEYSIWVSVMTVNEGQDSFFVGHNAQLEDIYDTSLIWTNAWQWTLVNGRGGNEKPFELSHAIDPRLFIMVGTNEVKFRGREQGTGIKAILITNDRKVVPKVPKGPINLQLTVEGR
jgi:hypothetical protein